MGVWQGLAAGLSGYDKGRQDADEYVKQAKRQALLDSLTAAQIGNLKSEAETRAHPKPPTPHYDEKRGVLVGADGSVVVPKGLPAEPVTPRNPVTLFTDKGLLEYDPTTQSFKPAKVEGVNGPVGRPAEAPKEPTRFTGADGKEYVYDAATQTVSLAKGTQPGPRVETPPKTTDTERKNAALYQVANDAFSTLQQAEPSAGIGGFLGRHGLSPLATEQQQAWNQAGGQFADAYLRLVSGAVSPEAEVQRLAKIITYQIGDKPAVRERKRHAQQVMLDALKTAGGPAIPTEPDKGGPSARARGLARQALGGK